MKPLLPLITVLAGCSLPPDNSFEVSRTSQVINLPRIATKLEVNCGLPAGSLLHPDADTALEISAVSASVSFSQFSCVMDAIQKKKLTNRGVKIIMTGEDAAH